MRDAQGRESDIGSANIIGLPTMQDDEVAGQEVRFRHGGSSPNLLEVNETKANKHVLSG